MIKAKSAHALSLTKPNLRLNLPSCVQERQAVQTQMLEPHSKAATHPHYACDFRYGEKMTKHGEPCRLAGMVFVPLVVETLGGWEEQGEKQIRRMGAALARQTGQDEAVKTRHLFQRLSILLTKGNAALFLNRLPSHPGPTIDGEQ